MSPAYAIKIGIADPAARTFTFARQKTMYGGKRIAAGDTLFIFASENELKPFARWDDGRPEIELNFKFPTSGKARRPRRVG